MELRPLAQSDDELLSALEQQEDVWEFIGTLPFPDEVDTTGLAETIGPLDELPFADGVADTIERFRRLLADGRLAAA